jgi:hypothetical protein
VKITHLEGPKTLLGPGVDIVDDDEEPRGRSELSDTSRDPVKFSQLHFLSLPRDLESIAKFVNGPHQDHPEACPGSQGCCPCPCPCHGGLGICSGEWCIDHGLNSIF